MALPAEGFFLDSLLDWLRDYWKPFTCAVTITLLLGFARKIRKLAGKIFGFGETTAGRPQDEKSARQETRRMSAPEEPLVRQVEWDKARRGLVVPKGWRCAIVHACVVQEQLASGRHGSRALDRIAGRKGLNSDARAVLYNQAEFPLELCIEPLFAADHCQLSLQILACFRLRPDRLIDITQDDAALMPSGFRDRLVKSLMAEAREWAVSLSGEDIVGARGMESACKEKASLWLLRASEDLGLELVRVLRARLRSEFLDSLYEKLEQASQEKRKLAAELEISRLRGAWRQEILAGKLREIEDAEHFDEVVRALQKDQALKDKTLRMELEQKEIDELRGKIEISRKKYLILKQAMEDDSISQQSSEELIARLCEAFESNFLGSSNSPFSPQEREQIRSILQARRNHFRAPEEVLSSIARDGGIEFSLFDPFAGLQGEHTLKVGEGWRRFDGENLWHIRLTRIGTRRHGFFWLKESPCKAFFEVQGSPGSRRLVQEIRPGEAGTLPLGARSLPIELLGGSAAQITVRIPQIPRTQGLKP